MIDQPIHPGSTTVAKTASNRRRRLLINPAEQRRFVMSISVPTLFMLLAVGAWAYWLEGAAYDDVATSGESYALTGFLPFGLGMFFAVMVFAATVVVQALRVSHRVSGSAYRLVKAMESARQGNLAQTVTLRKKDHLQEVAAELNSLLAWVRTQLPAQATVAGRTSKAPATPAEAPVEALSAQEP